MGFCLSNCPTHIGRVYLFPHTQNITKRTIKIKNPQNSIEKTKRKKEENQQEKIEINKILNFKKINMKKTNQKKKKKKDRNIYFKIKENENEKY